MLASTSNPCISAKPPDATPARAQSYRCQSWSRETEMLAADGAEDSILDLLLRLLSTLLDTDANDFVYLTNCSESEDVSDCECCFGHLCKIPQSLRCLTH